MVSPQRAPPVPRRSFEGSPARRQYCPLFTTLLQSPRLRPETNEWRRLPDWPVACPSGCGVGMTPLYLNAKWIPFAGNIYGGERGGVRANMSAIRASLSLTRLVPTALSRRAGSSWSRWLVDDQRFAAGRPDVLVYSSEALQAPVKIAGQPGGAFVRIHQRHYSDWVVKLIDVYPDTVPEQPELGGYSAPVAMDVLRGRYRDDPAKPSPIPASTVIGIPLCITQCQSCLSPGSSTHGAGAIVVVSALRPKSAGLCQEYLFCRARRLSQGNPEGVPRARAGELTWRYLIVR